MIDWTELAERFGTVTTTEHGRQESGGTKVARWAIAELLGEEVLRGAVDFYLTGRAGTEMARSVLRELRPQAAIERCREIFVTADDIKHVRAAIELLRSIANREVLDWYPDIMKHQDRSVRMWGLGVIDGWWLNGEIEPEEGVDLLQHALTDDEPDVRFQAEEFTKSFKDDIARNAADGETFH